MTAKEVKFSDAISSMPRHWRRFSFSMRSWISGSTAWRGVFPHSLTGSIAAVKRGREAGSEESERRGEKKCTDFGGGICVGVYKSCFGWESTRIPLSYF